MLVESTMTSVGDGVETESLRLSVRFDVEENSAADQPHEHPPSPPPPSMMDSSSSPNLKSKESKSYGTPFRETKSTKTPSPKGHRSFHSADLRSNLTREQRDRDPLFFYETVRTLGVGSMGSVARVKKRVNTVGGSARKGMQEVVRRQNRHKHCLNIPVIGGIFRVCVDGALQGPTSTLTNPNCGGGFLASWFRPKESPLTSSNESRSVQSAPSLHRIDSVGSMGSMTSNGSRSTASRQAIEYAMKSIHLSRVTDKTFLTELRNEISILKKLDHPHIVRAIETFEHRNQIFIIMELCSGGDLYSRDPYTEEDAARIVSSILSAIAYMHTKKILHRDLKYENVLFVNNSPKAEIKLIDFGLSKVYGDNTELTEGVGTIYTMAPEVLKGAYSEKADVWSVGVIAYMLLSSQMPFYGRKRRHIVEQILNGQFDFRGRRWKRISSQAKAFVEELLVLDDEERVDAQTAMRSTWLNRRFAATVRGPDPEEENMARHAMLRYAGYTKLKKMALMVVAHKSSSEEIGILRKVFQKYDKKRDGSIGFDDFSTALEEFGHTDDDLKEMFEAVDLDGTGRIRYTEFLAATIEARGAISEERLAEAFDRLDSDDSGKISANNLAEILGENFPRDEIDAIIAEANVTNDNQISYAEFLSLWEDRYEQDRIEHLRLLDSEVLTCVHSEPDMNSFRGSSTDLCSIDSQEDLESAEARVTFILEKHDTGKRVSFVGVTERITSDITIEPTLLIE